MSSKYADPNLEPDDHTADAILEQINQIPGESDAVYAAYGVLYRVAPERRLGMIGGMLEACAEALRVSADDTLGSEELDALVAAQIDHMAQTVITEGRRIEAMVAARA